MHESNKDMYVFCEPLHNELFKSIYKENIQGQCSHGYSTTSEYLKHGEKFLKHLKKFHPIIGNNVYAYKADEVIKYIKIFDELDKPVILQPNRMHFVLSDIVHHFNCKAVHIVRHPMDVFLSFMFSSPKSKYFRKLSGMNPYFFRLIRNRNPFFLDEQSKFVSRYFGVLQNPMPAPYKYFYVKKYYSERFLLCWTISNWCAVNEIDEVGGLIVRYEDIVSKNNTLQSIARYSGVRFDSSKIKIYKQSVAKYKKSDMYFCFNLAEQLGIKKEFCYLIERFNYSSF